MPRSIYQIIKTRERVLPLEFPANRIEGEPFTQNALARFAQDIDDKTLSAKYYMKHFYKGESLINFCISNPDCIAAALDYELTMQGYRCRYSATKEMYIFHEMEADEQRTPVLSDMNQFARAVSKLRKEQSLLHKMNNHRKLFTALNRVAQKEEVKQHEEQVDEWLNYIQSNYKS